MILLTNLHEDYLTNKNFDMIENALNHKSTVTIDFSNIKNVSCLFLNRLIQFLTIQKIKYTFTNANDYIGEKILRVKRAIQLQAN